MDEPAKNSSDLPSREHVAQALDQLLRLSARWVIKHLRSVERPQPPVAESNSTNRDADA